MPALLIFLSTLGGVYLFGAVGFLFGPLIAALFQSVWDMYGQAVAREHPPAVSIRGSVALDSPRCCDSPVARTRDLGALVSNLGHE